MAYEANISLKLKGYEKAQRQINTLVESVNKIGTAFNRAEKEGRSVAGGVKQANTQLTSAVTKARQLSVALRNASKAAQAVKTGSISNASSSESRSSGDGGGASFAIPIAQVKKLSKLEQEYSDQRKSNIDREILRNKSLENQLTKQADLEALRQSTVRDRLGRQVTIAANEGQITRLMNAQNKAAKTGKGFGEKSAQELAERLELQKKYKKELDKVNNSEKFYGEQVANNNKLLDDGAKTLDRIGQKIQRNARLRKAGASALAGAAFANIPGQDLIQAGAAGAAVGGPKGAAIAAAVAATLKLTTALAAFGKEATITASEVQKLNIALKGVAGADYDRSIAAITKATRDFNIPITDATRGFTRLFASASAAGFAFEDIEASFRGLSAANKALGGDVNKLNGLLLAATQVFAKGKVSAEELRGQIGERLPGALALFAKANKITLAELDKLLDQGKVTTKQFVDFLKKLGTDYELQAQLIGNSAEEAGARFGVAMEELKFKAGTTLIPVGAAFQDLATQITRAIIPLTEEGGAIQTLADAIRGLQIVAQTTGPIVGDIFRGMAKEINAAFDILNPAAAGAVNGLLAYFAQIGKEARELEERYKALNANKRTVTYATADQVTRENGGYITTEAKRAGEEMAKEVALAAKLEPFLIQKTELQKQLALAVGEQNAALRDELNYKIGAVDLAIRQFKALEGITDEKRRQQIIDDFARQQSVLLAKYTN